MAGGNIYGRAGGIVYPTTADKVFNIMNALGSIGERALQGAGGGWRGSRARVMHPLTVPPAPPPPCARAGFAFGFCYVQLEVHDTVK